MPGSGARRDVVVIGAGLSGLRCATDLAAAGRDVVVLEARDRVGGRVWSHRFADGQWCERGAEFIDGNHTEVLSLARELGLSLTLRSSGVDARATMVDAGGRAVPMQLHATLAPDRERWDRAVAGLRADGAHETSTLADLLHSLGLSVMARVVIGRDIRTEYMLPPEEVSQRFAAHVAAHQAEGQRERHRIVGGNDQLATGLASRLGDRVRRGVVVESIDADGGRVSLADGTVLHADHVVAAVPLPVLSRLWPEMPLELGAVGYGVGGKVSMQFSRRVWRDYGRNGTVFSDRAWGHLWETTDDQAGDPGVLTALLASHDGAAFLALPEATDRILAEIERIYPGAKGLVGERVRTDWTNDPWSLGTYACFGAGQWGAARPALDARHGRTWLAGEHTDAFAGFMEGALRSGGGIAAAILG
jgi:monoamine oxidase